MSEMTLEEFAKTLLVNACGRSVRDSADRDKVIYNSHEVPAERQEVLYTFDLHCVEVSVWVKHSMTGGDPVILEFDMKES